MHEDDVSSKKIAELLKKAVSIGAGAYVSAEDKVSRTLNSVQAPKEILREALESFFDRYSVQINAELKFTPKDKKDKAENKTEEKNNSDTDQST